MRKFYPIYIFAFFAVCLIPSAGLFFGGGGDTAESQDVAEMPSLAADGRFNEKILSDAGTYFEDHFAFRSEWVTAYSFLADKIFGVSAQDGVIVGTDGWLYYKDSLDDYQGADQMTDRQLFDLAHSLAMVQQYASENSVDFAFAVAPNKNSLYGGHMPYYYRGFRTEGGNLQRLTPYLKEEGVNYVDLYGLLRSQDEVLYHVRDSHWNNKGAAMAADAILTSLGKKHASYEGRDYQIRRDYEGDLDGMLCPAAVKKEDEVYYDPLPSFTYVKEVESNFAPKIYTENTSAAGSLVMYRDSFGNALLPFMAEAYGDSYFSRAVPYQLTDLFSCNADTMVIERAERFLPEMAAQAPMMAAPIASSDIPADAEFSEDIIQNLSVSDQGAFTRITGELPKKLLHTRSKIYIRVNGLVDYEAFPVALADGTEGFQLLVATETLEQKKNSFCAYLSE